MALPLKGSAPVSFTSTTSAVVLAANSRATLRLFANDSDKDLYLRFDASACSIAAGGYTVKVAAGEFYWTDYRGEVRGMMSAAIGVGWVNVTEAT